MKIKKILTTVLAVVMVMGLIPSTALAAEGNVAEVNGVQYADLQTAINEANGGDTVTLLDDINYASTAASIVTIKKSLTLDLGEYTITSTKAGREAVLRVVAPDANTSIDVTINATTGGIKATAKRMAIYSGLNTVAETNVTINGGNYDAGQVTCVWANNGLLTINGGSYKSSSKETVLDTYDGAACKFMINGGSFYGFNPACMSVQSGNHHDHDNVPAGFTAVKDDEGWFTVTEGCFMAKTVCSNASNTAHNHCYASLKDAQAAANSCDTVVAIEGATAVAKVNNDEYGALSEAISDVASGGTVTLLKDVTLTTPVIINKSLSFDLGAYTLTSTADEALRIVGDESIDVTITANAGGGINAANTALYAGNAENDNAKTNVTINGGTYVAEGTDCIRQINGLLTINGGSYKSSFGRTVLNGQRWYGAEFAIKGGTFYGFNPACVSVWTGFDGKNWNNFYHQHDIIAAGKTAKYADGWYTVVDEGEGFDAKVEAKSLCYPSVDVALQAIVDMNDVANLGVLTLVADDTLTKTELAITNNFAFILNGNTLTLPEDYELYDVILEDGREAAKVKAAVTTEGSDAVATETVSVSSAADLNAVLKNEESKIIVLNADFALDLDLDLAAGSILDLNGHTITLPKKGIEISGKNITVKNGTIACEAKNPQYLLYIAEGTTATIESVTISKGAIYAKNGVDLTLKENTIKPWGSGNASAVYANGAKVTVLSGTFKGSTQGIFKEAYGGKITVYSGRFDRKNASYKYSLSNFVAEGSELVKAVDGVYKYEVVPVK